MTQHLDISQINQEEFVRNYLEWEALDKGNLMKMRLMTECCNCKETFGGPSDYQKIGERKYICDPCMKKVFDRVKIQLPDPL